MFHLKGALKFKCPGLSVES